MSTDRTSPLDTLIPAFRSDELAERLSVGWRAIALCATTSLLFLYFDNLPIYHTDIWGHVSYGEWIIEHGRLPTEDPFLDLAEGVPLVDTAWLSQLAFAWTYSTGGAAWISHLFALLMVGAIVLFTVALGMRTGSPVFGILSAIGILALAPTRIAVVRPETFGLFMAAGLFLLMTSAERRLRDGIVGWRTWMLGLTVAAVMLLWANLHGSYVVGLAVIGARVLGRGLEVLARALVEARRERNDRLVRTAFAAVVRDPAFRFWLVTVELAIAATCLNPYGVDLLINAFLFPSNPNLTDVLEWKPLPLISVEGIVFMASWILLVLVSRFSRVSFRAHEVIALAVLNLAVVKGVRMINWYAVVYVFAVAPHVRDVLERMLSWYRENWQFDTAGPPTPSPSEDEPAGFAERLRGRSLVHTAVCVLVLWWGFAFSPMGNTLLGGDPRPVDRLHHEWTPHDTAEYLATHPSPGRVFNPQWFGDWFVREAPDQRYFMTTNAVHLAPQRVWRDYLRVARGAHGWEEVLTRYDVSTVVVHEELQRQLLEQIRTDDDWRLIHEDDVALVFERKSKEVSP